MLSLIIPVYKNEENIADLIKALSDTAPQFKEQIEVVFVVDGSPDRSHEIIESYLPRTEFKSQLISLSRNFGSFSAIRAGLQCAKGNIFAVMAADLQEPLELILKFEEKLKNKDCDIVFGKRIAREDPVISQISSKCFWYLYCMLINKDIPEGGVDIFGCNNNIREQILKLEESNSSLIALLFWVGFKRLFVEYERRKRVQGKSAWTFRRKLKYLMDSVFGFTDLPIRILLWIGIIGLSFSSGLGVIILLSKLFGLISVPGYAATVIVVIFFGALNCLGFGILGSYTWRTFENSKLRPNFIINSSKLFY